MTAADASVATAGPDPAADGEDRILTIPNLISLVRLSCLPLFVYLLFGRDNRAAASILLGSLAATDWIDGYIARRYHQVSTVGKVLDPVADRLLFFVGVTAIVIDGSVPVWLAAMVLVREAVVAVTTVVLAALGARRIDVTWWGKAGTFGLMMAFPFFLAAESTMSWAPIAGVLAWVTAIPGLFCSYVSWAMYLPIGLRALREGRAARAAVEVAG
mgnify:CR=1 FL=1